MPAALFLLIMTLVLESVKKTGRIVLASDACATRIIPAGYGIKYYRTGI